MTYDPSMGPPSHPQQPQPQPQQYFDHIIYRLNQVEARAITTDERMERGFNLLSQKIDTQQYLRTDVWSIERQAIFNKLTDQDKAISDIKNGVNRIFQVILSLAMSGILVVITKAIG